MRNFYPKGKCLPALEKNILKYRAFEMLIILFHVEELKSFILGAIRETDKIRYGHDKSQHRLPDGTKDMYKKMWAILVSERVITQEESNGIQSIIDYRNDIAHAIQKMTFDIDSNKDFIESYGVTYDYKSLKRLELYKEKIHKGLSGNYILPLTFNPLLFESAENTFKQELRRLDKRISRLIAIRESESEKVKAEIETIHQNVIKEIQPNHPKNFKNNGQLSKRGVECCHAIFANGVSNLSACYLMRMSLKSITMRRKEWEAQRA